MTNEKNESTKLRSLTETLGEDRGHAYAWGGGGLLTVVLIILIILILF